MYKGDIPVFSFWFERLSFDGDLAFGFLGSFGRCRA